MSDEVKKAAERLRRLNSYGGDEFAEQVYNASEQSAVWHKAADERRLALAYLATVAADEQPRLGVQPLKWTAEPPEVEGYYLVTQKRGGLRLVFLHAEDMDEVADWYTQINNKTGFATQWFGPILLPQRIALTPIGQGTPTITIAGERIAIVGDIQDSKHIGEIVYRPGVDAYDTSVNESLAVVDIEATLRANGYAWQRQGNDYVVTPAKSRSVLRREAAQRGEEPPEFSSGREGE